MKVNRRKFMQSTAMALGATAINRSASADDQANAFQHPKGHSWNKRSLKKRPNILIAVLDDVGFSDFGPYGADHSTGCIDRLAAEGARFNNFHVTALCAPTRACLLTGRNAHAVGVGNIAEWGRDLPGYQGWVRQDAATLAEILKPQGYTNLAIGKWHLSKIDDQNATGPYDLWPVGRGFDRWYGFHGNAMDHFHPELFENTVAAYPDKSNDYHLSEDLVDHGIQYIQDHLSAAPDKPFFMYLAFGACHFPHHAPDDYIKRQNGKYDEGWDNIRAARYERQKRMGIIPENAELAPRTEGVPAWDSLKPIEQKIAARGQEVYSAMLEHTDEQLQRLIDFLEREQQLDDTIVVVLSDNGAAGSAQPLGTLDLRRSAYLGHETTEHLIEHFDAIGTEHSQFEYAKGWAQVSNTPLRWYKADTYGGGTRSPLVMRWRNGHIPENTLLEQYHHVIDVVPSLLQMINAEMPEQVNEQRALALQGSSFAYAFDTPQAPSSKTIQYFETAGDRALWADGWKAVVRHHGEGDYDDDVWELFNLDQDFSEMKNLAEHEPERLKHMITLWFEEAMRYDVLPMEHDLGALYEKCVPPPRARYAFYPGMTRLDRLSAPDIYHFNSKMSAEVDISGKRANGVLLASGDGSMGYEWFLQDGWMHFVYVYTREQVYRLRSKQRVPAGSQRLDLNISKTGESSATLTMTIEGKPVGTASLPKLWPIYSPNSGIRCGENSGAPISNDYKGAFAFNQILHRVIVDVDLPS